MTNRWMYGSKHFYKSLEPFQVIKIGFNNHAFLLKFIKKVSGVIKHIFTDNKKIIMSRITIRLEDLVPVGTMTINSCETDIVDFEALSPEYSPAFITTARTEMAAVDAIMNPRMLINERVIITQRIDTNLGLLLDPMNKLEYYVVNASGLTILAKDFGISEVRAARNSGDMQELDTALRDLLANTAVPANLAALIAKGYSVAQNTVIVNLRADYSSDNAAQVAKDKQITTLRTNNGPVLQDFWDKLSQIWSAGKSIYKVNNPDNAKYYTLSHIESIIHNNALHGGFRGKVTLLGVATKGLVVEIKPVLGGHTRKSTTNKEGDFDITSLAGAEYAYTVYQAGVVVKAGTFVLATAEKKLLDIAA